MHRVGFLLAEMACSLLLVSFMSLVLARCYYTMRCIEQDSIRRLHAISLVQCCSERFIRPLWFEARYVTLRSTPHHERPGTIRLPAHGEPVTITTTKMPSNQPGFVLTKITAHWPSVRGHEESITTYVGAFCES